MTTLAYERGPADVGVISSYRNALRQLEEIAIDKGLDADVGVRKALAKAYVRGEALRINVLQQLSKRANGRSPGDEISVAKLLATAADQSLHHLALDLLGAEVLTDLESPWLSRYFTSRTSSVIGGTSQIQKNILAQRVLGMPRQTH